MAQAPSFITRDPQAVLADIVAAYEAAVGRTLQPAQVERLLLNEFAYRESLLREAIQDAATQNLVAFSRAPVLDYLGELVGVYRLAPQRATVTIRFTITANPLGLTIPQGLRVATADGRAVFRTIAATIVAATVLTADVECEATIEGTAANGYAPGTIATIIDPQPYLSAATNTNQSAGGADQETDESVRERIRLAPSRFSTAGSIGAYKFHAISANQNIVDVAVVSPIDSGIVYLYPLMADGSVTPSQIIAQVEAACSGEQVRPLSDLVIVQSPTRVNYALTVGLVVYATADPVAVRAQVEAALQAFVNEKRRILGRDITASQVVAVCQVAGVYSVNLVGFSDIIIAPTEFPFCTSISVTVTASTNG